MPRTQVSVVVALATVGAAFLCARALHPRPPRVEGDAFARLAEDEDFRRQQADWDERIAAAVRRLSEKRAVSLALVRGELSLRQAVDRFRAIIGGDPAVLDHLRRFRPNATDDELLYRNVVGFARNVFTEWPDLSPELLDQVEVELAAAFPAPDR